MDRMETRLIGTTLQGDGFDDDAVLAKSVRMLPEVSAASFLGSPITTHAHDPGMRYRSPPYETQTPDPRLSSPAGRDLPSFHLLSSGLHVHPEGDTPTPQWVSDGLWKGVKERPAAECDSAIGAYGQGKTKFVDLQVCHVL